MPAFKGFDIPADFPLALRVFLSLVRFRTALASQPLPGILRRIRSGKTKNVRLSPEHEKELGKVWRICNLFLRRIAGSDGPCLLRALVVFDFCCRRGLDAVMAIGVRKNSDSGLSGHGWVEIEGHPFLENTEELEKYAIMLKG